MTKYMYLLLVEEWEYSEHWMVDERVYGDFDYAVRVAKRFNRLFGYNTPSGELRASVGSVRARVAAKYVVSCSIEAAGELVSYSLDVVDGYGAVEALIRRVDPDWDGEMDRDGCVDVSDRSGDYHFIVQEV